MGIRDLLKRPSGLKLRYHDRNIVANEAGTSKNFDSKMEVDQDNENSEPDLHRLWIQLFRVMDDVHDGTRKASEGTAKVVSKVCQTSLILLLNVCLCY